jgi:DNA-binding NtrC family response regulator
MEMPLTLQSKLLRALETRSFFRVGGIRKVEVDVRLIAATNRDPQKAIAEGTFRPDLLYRINSFEIHIPPLRERREDIEPLTHHILQKIAGPNPPQISPEAMEALKSYDWFGNVRQLRNALERAVLLCDQGIITLRELPPEVVHKIQPTIYEPKNFSASTQSPTLALREIEKRQILSALEKTGWHRGKTARLLGISPSTLYRRLKEYGLER